MGKLQIFFIFPIFVYLFISLGKINLDPFFIWPSYKRPNLFFDECFAFINGDQIHNSSKCYVHKYYRKYLSCHFGVAPSQAQDGYILILGSAGRIGLSFTKALKEMNYRFIEIRGKLHFNLNKTEIFELFEHIKIVHVFDFIFSVSGERLHQNILSFFNQKGILVTRVSQTRLSKGFDQVIVKPLIFGNQYLKNGVSTFFNSTFHCLLYNQCEMDASLDDASYISVYDLVPILISRLFHSKPSIIEPKFKTFNTRGIWSRLLLFKSSQLTRNDPFYQIFSDISEAARERSYRPYLSIGYLISDDPPHYLRALKTLQLYDRILKLFPDLSLEIILFFVQYSTNHHFLDVVPVPKALSNILHIFEISNSSLHLIHSVLKTKSLPEYFFRDIEIRLGRGELLMTGSSDVYPSPDFFEIVQRKQMSHFTLLKSYRIPANNSLENYLLNYLQNQENPNAFLIPSLTQADFESSIFKWRIGCIGDTQGALRTTMYHINGWIFGKAVWAVDEAFAYDFLAFKVPAYILTLSNSMHQEHQAISRYTPRFRFKGSEICAGYPTKYSRKYRRANWGISYNFRNGRSKYGHLVYDVIPNIDNISDFHVSEIFFKLLVNGFENFADFERESVKSEMNSSYRFKYR